MSEQIVTTYLRGTTGPLGGSPIEPGTAVTVSANAPGWTGIVLTDGCSGAAQGKGVAFAASGNEQEFG
jgi:hypothetical protein